MLTGNVIACGKFSIPSLMGLNHSTTSFVVTVCVSVRGLKTQDQFVIVVHRFAHLVDYSEYSFWFRDTHLQFAGSVIFQKDNFFYYNHNS